MYALTRTEENGAAVARSGIGSGWALSPQTVLAREAVVALWHASTPNGLGHTLRPLREVGLEHGRGVSNALEGERLTRAGGPVH
jgi:hypothetical protein